MVAVERLDDAREAEPLAAATASSSVSTTSARGTGRPAESRSRLVRLLSDAMSTPIADVSDVIVARIRCWWTPWPSWTRRVAVEPDERDVAADRLVDERLGRRPERLPLGEPDEPLELGREVEEDLGVVRGDEVVDQATAILPASSPTASSRYS